MKKCPVCMTEIQDDVVCNSCKDTVVKRIIASIEKKDVIILCGSGISMNSGVPTVVPFTRYVLDKLEVPEQDQKYILGSELKDLCIPFEALMEDIQENSDSSQIKQIYEMGEPNTNHCLLAKLMRLGLVKNIITTNFDKLIEKSLMQECGWQPGREYELYYAEEQLSKIEWDSEKPKLVKLHGSVDDKTSMAITIKQIASKELSAARKNVVEFICSKGRHEIILLLGYSCSDVFDINPEIETIKTKGSSPNRVGEFHSF